MRIASQLKYQLHLWFRSSKWVSPLVFIVIFLYLMYSIAPLQVEGGYIVSTTFLFLVMGWIGMMSVREEISTTEYLLYLRNPSKRSYYLAKLVWTAVLALIVTMLCLVFPIIQNVLKGGKLFIRAVTCVDILNAFLIMSGAAICGGSVGTFFHPCFVRDRRWSVLYTLAMNVLAIVKVSIVHQIPAMKYILWVIPSATLSSELYHEKNEFHLMTSLLILGIYLLYAVVLHLIKCHLCDCRRFQ